MMITTQQELNSACTTIAQNKIIACDTEFVRNHTLYTPKLCLIQIATQNEETFIFDTLVNLDFSPLKKILTDKNILKIFHSVEQDSEVIFKNFNIDLENIFDTQQALLFLGHEIQCSYARILKDTLNIELKKDNQYSDWAKRPLLPEQINYARNDVKYLLQLYSIIKNQLGNKYSWVQEESNALKYVDNQEEFYINNLKTILPHESKKKCIQDVLKILLWREEQAQNQNTHIKNILPNEKIKSFIKYQKPRNQILHKRLNDIIAKPLDEQYQSIIENYLNKLAQLDSINKSTLQLISILTTFLAKSNNIPAYLLANKQDLINILLNEESRINHGWRKIIFKNYAELLKNGKLAISMQGNEIYIQHVDPKENINT